MLKMKITRSEMRLGYDLYIYEEDSQGNVKMANPLKLEFQKNNLTEGAISFPTLTLPMTCEIVNEVNNLTGNPNKELLSQKDKDKTLHIDNLNEIIKLLMENSK